MSLACCAQCQTLETRVRRLEDFLSWNVYTSAAQGGSWTLRKYPLELFDENAATSQGSITYPDLDQYDKGSGDMHRDLNLPPGYGHESVRNDLDCMSVESSRNDGLSDITPVRTSDPLYSLSTKSLAPLFEPPQNSSLGTPHHSNKPSHEDSDSSRSGVPHQMSCMTGVFSVNRDNSEVLPPAKTQPWKTAAVRLIRRTPTASAWRLDDTAEDLEVRLLQGTKAIDLTCECPRKRLELFASATAGDAKLIKFRQFLGLSACAVLHKLGDARDQGEVRRIARLCCPSIECDSRTWEKYRLAIQWANQLVDTVDKRGWKQRAVQLLYIWNQSPSAWNVMRRKSGKSLKFISDAICSADYLLPEEPGAKHITVSVLIQELFIYNHEVPDIERALGI